MMMYSYRPSLRRHDRWVFCDLIFQYFEVARTLFHEVIFIYKNDDVLLPPQSEET